jgi:photosystem II stability/assembly factor-like uncharacterized protein
MSKVVLVLGTKKGLFTLTSDAARETWTPDGPFLQGNEVTHGTLDTRDGSLYATDNNPWFGPRVGKSSDMGANWTFSENSPRFPEDSGKSVAKGWRIAPGRDSQPGLVYCGVDPASMFRSEDAGASWIEETALNEHPTRDKWTPGNGGLIVHSIVLDPKVDDRMWVAISAAGVFRSDDGGASWQPKNNGVRNVVAKYDPSQETYPEVGQCVHHLVRAAGDGDRLYAQGHWGTFRSDNGGDSWTEITQGLPSDFGMVMGAHPYNPDVAYTVPLVGGEFRCPPDAALRVYRTSDAGKTWEPMTKGLPQTEAYMGIYREGMAVDTMPSAGIYFGTNTGQLYASKDDGDSWHRIKDDLPPISSVSAIVI